MAHKKGSGSTRNGRDSNAQRLGVKKYGKTTYQALQLPIELIQKTLSILDRETAVLVEQALS